MSGSPDYRITGIGQIAVNVHNLERAVAFYRDTLGMQFLFDASNMAFFQCGDVRLMLGLPDRPELDHPASLIYYKVTDIDAAHESLAGCGVKFEQPPGIVHRTDSHDLWMAFLRDSEGNLLALVNEVPRTSES
jgi:catechol 2,3-dioxygenase-like lactoylglutathione lyase family enzyme